MRGDCFDRIKEAFPEVSKRQIQDAMDSIEMRLDRFERQNGRPATREEHARISGEVLDGIKRDRIQAYREVTLRALHVEDAVLQAESEAFRKKPWKALTARMFGGETSLSQGGNRSVDLIRQARTQEWQSNLAMGVERSGFSFNAARDGSMDLALFKELAAAGGDPKYAVGATGNTPAIKLAEIASKINHERVKTLQDLGSPIREMKGYVITQTESHDPAKILNAGFGAWKDDILARLDIAKTFEGLGPEEINTRLEQTYNEMVTGQWHLRTEEKNPRGGVGSTRLGDKTAASRSLHFKSVEDFHDYHQKYGNGTAVQLLARSYARSARDAAILEMFGTNPRATFDEMTNAIRERIQKSGDVEMLENFNQEMPTLGRQWDTQMGVSDAPGRSTGAKMVMGARNLNAATQLGRTIFNALPTDIVQVAGRISNTFGENHFKSIGKQIAEWGSTFASPSERTRAYMQLRDMLHDYSGGMSPDTPTKPGALSKLSAANWKWSGMSRHTEVMGEVMARRVQTILGDESVKEHASLGEPLQRELDRFGIGPHEWTLLSQAVDDVDGRKVMTAEAIRRLDKEDVQAIGIESGKIREDDKFMKTRVDLYHRQLESSFLSFVQDHMDIATTTPRGRYKSILMQGTHADTPTGMLLRLTTQYLNVPLQIMGETVRQTITAGGKSGFFPSLATKSGGQAFAWRMASMTAAGYASITLRDLLKGKSPPDPLNQEVMMDSMVRGGALGLYADYLFGYYDQARVRGREGGRAVEHKVIGALGPTVGRAAEGAQLLYDGLQHNAKSGDVVNFAIKQTPFQSLWWARGAVDYMFLNAIQEQATPGWGQKQSIYEQGRMMERGQTKLFEGAEP